MKKNIYTGIFCTILGLCINTPANASIVSSGFLDEKLTEMTNATALQLDTKANQSDFTDLSNKIGDWSIKNQTLSWSNIPYLSEFFPQLPTNGNWAASDITDMLGYSYIISPQAPTLMGAIMMLLNGWTNAEKKTYLGVKGLNDKIGTLPEGITVQGMLDGWTNESGAIANPGLKGVYEGWIGNNGLHTQGLQMLELDSFYTYNLETDSPQEQRGQKGGLLNVLSSLVDDSGYFELGGALAPFWKLTQSAYKTDVLSTKIGTLPSGNFPSFPGSDHLFPWLNQPLTYPTSLAELINAIYGDEETRIGLLPGIIARFPIDTDGDGDTDVYTGLIPNFRLANDANNLANANATKIGTVPDGKNLAGMISETDAKIGTLPSGSLLGNNPAKDFLFMYTQNTDTPVFPNSLSDLINQLYGNSETGAQGLLAAIITGFPIFDTDGDGSPDEPIGLMQNFQSAGRANNLASANATKIGTVPDGKNLAGMISETDAKIGTLPTEYETVGAALSAIKGIAEEAKAAALAAIPDPKTEGSNGKYVLTVDIVGDNATYRWEPIDRGDTTPTTE